MASAGIVSFITKGEYSASTTYKRLNTVRYNNKVYVALKTVTGVTPSDDGENWKLFVDTPDVTLANNLTTDKPGTALDATQGKLLNTRISNNGYGEVAGGKNLANPKNFVKNKVVSFDTGYITDNPNYFVSGYIEVKPNTTYVRQGASDGSENYSYDENKKPISIIGTKFTTSSNTKYVCLSGLTGKENIMMLEEGSVATEYEPYFPSNKMLAEEKADKSETTVNLLNPTLQTTTSNGVTCTNNGDGTYTLNGTATNNNATFDLSFSCSLNSSVKLLGRPKNIDGVMIQTMYNGSWDDPTTWDNTGNGAILSDASKINRLSLFVLKDKSVKNAIIKPMITTNLNATYDDFVPYTGDSGKLNSDVASLLKRIEALESLTNKTDTTVTE